MLRSSFTGPEWDGGRYSPDFYARADNTHWLIEVKSDKEMTSPDVVAKRAAAERWARRVTDEGGHEQWRYLLVSESALRSAKGTWAVLLAQALAV